MGRKITVIGAGSVGASIVYTLAVEGIASDILMIDINKEKALGEAMDISQGASFFGNVNIHAGEYEEAVDSDIVIITSGLPRKPGQTRLDLAKETGADFILNVTGLTQEEVAEKLIEGMGGKAAYMAECSGVDGTMYGPMMAVAKGGKIAQVGVVGEAHFDAWWMGPLNAKEITFISMGNMANDQVINLIVDLYQQGKFPIDKVEKKYKFEDINQAIQDHMAGKVIKPVLQFE